MYINDLSTSLELEKIDRLTVNEYYAELLSRYYSIERLQLKNRCAPGELEAFKTSLLVREKASAGCPEVYSEAFWAIIKDEAARAMSDILGNKLRIAELNSILKEKTPYGVDADTRSIKNIAELRLILDHIKAEFEPYYRQLKIRIESEAALASAEDEFLKLKAALPNAEALLDRLTRETAAKEMNLRLTYEQRKTMLSVQLKQLKAELKRTSQEPRRKQLMHGISHVLSDLYECDFCLCALKYERLKHVLDIDRKKLQEESDRLPFTDDDMVLIENAYAFTESFSVAMLEKSVLEAVKARCGAPLSFRNQIYIRLLTRYYLQGPLTNAEKLLCIDEGHDLCANEYRLLAAVCGNGLRFNIYGDVNQLIGEGISDWLELKNTFDFTLFTLNENYRNSAEIIEYCNGTLGFDTTNLGVGGDPVAHLDMDGFVRHANDAIIGTRKVAVIVKQKAPSLLALLRERLLDKVNTGEINPGEIAVLTPREAKGLEFDTCYVMTKGMSRNEKYIAFTRALNELYIIDPKLKADK